MVRNFLQPAQCAEVIGIIERYADPASELTPVRKSDLRVEIAARFIAGHGLRR